MPNSLFQSWAAQKQGFRNGCGEMKTAVEQEKTVLWEVPSDQEVFYTEELPALAKKPIYEFVKRLFDIMMSFAALIILAIPMAVIALVIVLESPGNPIYAQTRLGKGEKPFTIYKFRSMPVDAEADGLRWADSNDDRVTGIGKVLRETRLDELPQLWNILIGEMSFVGPRPERPEFYAVFDTYIIGFRQRMVVKPGLTGLAQVTGGYELLPEEKIRYDLDYIIRRSMILDIQCILRTFGVVFWRRR